MEARRAVLSGTPAVGVVRAWAAEVFGRPCHPFPGHLAPARSSPAAGNNAVVSAGRASTRRPFDCHEAPRKPQIARTAPHACPAPRATRAVSVAGFGARRGAESALPPPRASRPALRRATQFARDPLGTARPPERRPSDGERTSEGCAGGRPSHRPSRNACADPGAYHKQPAAVRFGSAPSAVCNPHTDAVAEVVQGCVCCLPLSVSTLADSVAHI